jgi:hypothetical protein
MDPATLMMLAQLAMQAYGAYQKSQSASSQQGALEGAAGGARTDPYGNTFTPGGGWAITPESRGILSAEQGEMLRNLTEDARRNRDFRARMEDRSIQAGEDYDSTRSEFLYGEQPNEAQIIDELTQLMQLQYGRSEDATKATLARQALRMNQGGMIDKIMQGTGRNAAEGLVESILRGRQAGRQEYQSAKGFRDTNLLNTLGQFGATERNQPQANVAKSGLYTSMNTQAENATNALIKALGANKTSASGGFDVSQLAPLIGKLSGAFGGGSAQAPTTGWDAWIEQDPRTIGNSGSSVWS